MVIDDGHGSLDQRKIGEQQAYVVGLVPYLLTMFIMTGIIGKTSPPAADGQPYEGD